MASVELRHAMIMQIGSTATNDPRISLTIAVKQNCTLGPVTLHWKAGDGLDAEGYGVLSVRPFAIKIANQPDEVHTGVDSRSPDTDDRYFTFGGLTPQRLSGVNGRLAIWIPGRGDGLVADGKIYFSLDGFDRASEHATKLCEHSLYFTPWAVIQ